MTKPPSKAKLLDGRAPAKRLREAARRDVERIRQVVGFPPTLATVLVGHDPASAVYVRMKRRRCDEVGIVSRTVELAANTTTEELINRIEQLGGDSSVHAILIQHPVPGTVDRRAAFEAIPLEKDVDSVSSAAFGRAILGMDTHSSCTPAGIMRLLAEYDVELEGAHAAVLGRSPILGRPMASMLINAHATVTLCHSRTRQLPEIVGGADVLIAAVGQPKFVRGDWIKPGSVVVDAGYNEGNVGDVDFEAALDRASMITPVPGGVGPMTIAVLLRQTVDAAARQCGVTL